MLDVLSSTYSLKLIQLRQLILTTQALGANIESRTQRITERYIRLLEYGKEYNMQEEARILIEQDLSVIKKIHKELKYDLELTTNKETIKQSVDIATQSLKKYKEV